MECYVLLHFCIFTIDPLSFVLIEVHTITSVRDKGKGLEIW
nr:MAG TPA: hypothetical protein [Caudoviricetes sp.]